MKKFISLLLCFVFFLLHLTGCGDEAKPTDDLKIRIAGMKGPTSIGLVGVMENNQNQYEFTLEGTADAIVPKLIKGELDMAAVPANLASTLYNNTEGEIQILAVNTLGVLYILSKGDITSVADLKGKTILATGKGTTPEYTLRHILSENGISPDNDVILDFKSEATEVVASLAQTEGAVAMLPQPYVTIALNKLSDYKVSLDLNKDWQSINPESSIVTGVLVVRKSFADENEEAIKSFLAQYKASVEMVNSNASEAAKLVVEHGIFDNEKVIEAAIPNCNITFISGEDMKTPVNKYLGVLYEQNEKSVGGEVPKDDFFRIIK